MIIKQKLKELITDEIQSTDGNISVIIKNLNNEEYIYTYKEERKYKSASIIKILIMVEAMYQAYNGVYKLDDKIKVKQEEMVDYSLISDLKADEYCFLDLITLMIIVSDNTATNVLIDILGYDKINKRARILGCDKTILQRKMMDFKGANEGKENYTNLKDMDKILTYIYKKQILNEEYCNLMIEILLKQRHKNMLARYIRDDIKIGHKTGDLTGINHDIGIIFLEDVDYIIGIFTSEMKDDLEGKIIIGSISEKVYEYFIKFA